MTAPNAQLPPAGKSAPAGWYPIGPAQIGYWDGVTWAWLPPPPQPPNPIGEPIVDVPEISSPLASLVGLLAAFGLAAVMAVCVAGAPLPQWALLLCAFAPIWAGLSYGCWLGARRSGVSFRASINLPRTAQGWWRSLLIGACAGVALRIAAAAVAVPFAPHLDTDAVLAQTTLVGDDPSSGLLVVFAFGAVVGAPVFEEAFFRNVVYPTMARRIALPAAVVLQGLVFSIVHLSAASSAAQNAMTVCAILVVGTGLGLLRRWTRTLAACVVAHAVFNAIAVAGVVALPWLERLAESA